MSDKLITIKEAASILGVDPHTLRQWDKSGKFKPHTTVGKRKDRRYLLSTVEEELNKHPNQKGSPMEIILKELMEALLNELGFQPLVNRRQKSGQQYGKDNIVSWVGRVEGKDITFNWSLESKNYGTRTKATQIDSDSIRSKLTSVYNSKIPKDCWCIFSPFGYVDNDFEELVEGTGNYPFKLVLWTEDHHIADLISCFPAIYEKIYKSTPSLTPEQRKKILSAWKKDIIDKTLEGKSRQDSGPTKSVTNASPKLDEKLIKEGLQVDTTESKKEVYSKSIKLSQPSESPTISQSILAQDINDTIESIKIDLDSGKGSEALSKLYVVLGRIEHKPEFNHETARVYNNLGVAYNILNIPEKAMEYFKKAALQESDFIIAEMNLAALYLLEAEKIQFEKKENSNPEIIKFCENAEKIITPRRESKKYKDDPRILQQYLRLIKLTLPSEELVNKIKELEIPMSTIKKSVGLSLTLGNIYLTCFLPEEALSYAEIAVKIESIPETLIFRGRVYFTLAIKNDTDIKNETYQDIVPTFKSNSNLKKAIKDFDLALELAIKDNLEFYYSEISYFQKMSKAWLGEDIKELRYSIKLEKTDNKEDQQILKVIQDFRSGKIQEAYFTLRSLPHFNDLPYTELFRYGRIFLNNGFPEISLEIFKRIEDQATINKDFVYWLDISTIYSLLGDKNKSIWAASKAKEFAKNPEEKRVAYSHFGAVVLRYAKEEGGDRLLENALEFKSEFPDLDIIKQIDFEKEKENIVKDIKDRMEWGKNITNLYKNNPLFSYHLEKTFRKPFVVIWSGRNPDFTIEAFNFSSETRNEINANFDPKKKYYFDYISLLTLAHLDLLNDLKRIIPNMEIPFSLFLKIQRELCEEENPTLRRLWNYLRKSESIDIVKKIPNKKIPGIDNSEFIDSWMSDLIKLSSNQKSIVVTDDNRVFRFLKSIPIKSIDSWKILSEIKSKELIDDTMYSKAIGKLAECFYTFISFNGDDLYTIIAEDNFKLTPRNFYLIEEVFLPGSDYLSFSKVFVKFTGNLWRSGSLIQDKIYWLNYITAIVLKMVEDGAKSANEAITKDLTIIVEDLAQIWIGAVLSCNKSDLNTLSKSLPKVFDKEEYKSMKESINTVIDERKEKLNGK